MKIAPLRKTPPLPEAALYLGAYIHRGMAAQENGKHRSWLRN